MAHACGSVSDPYGTPTSSPDVEEPSSGRVYCCLKFEGPWHTVLFADKVRHIGTLISPSILQSNGKIEELLQEDQNVKRRREKFQRQSSLLSKLTRQLSIHDNRAAAASWSDVSTGAESSRTPSRVSSSGDDWRSAFDGAANGSMSHSNSFGRSSSANGHSRRYEATQNGDVGGYGANSGSRRTPNRLPPAPPQGSGNSSMYRY